MEAERRAGLVALVVTLLLVSTLGGYLAYAHQSEEGGLTSSFGYTITDAVLNEG
jgi:hypothetical protein